MKSIIIIPENAPRLQGGMDFLLSLLQKFSSWSLPQAAHNSLFLRFIFLHFQLIFSSRCLQLSNNHVPLKLRTRSSHHPEKNIYSSLRFSQASSPSSQKKSLLNPPFVSSHSFHCSWLISSYRLPCLLR